jgi:hypothetical protein
MARATISRTEAAPHVQDDVFIFMNGIGAAS